MVVDAAHEAFADNKEPVLPLSSLIFETILHSFGLVSKM